MPIMEIIDGPDAGRQLRVPPEGGRIGRGAECELRLNDTRASRQHAQIRCVGPDQFEVCDLGSVNGTQHNGTAIDKTWVLMHDADELRLGQTTLRFVLRGVLPGDPAPDAATVQVSRLQVMETQGIPFLQESAETPPHEQLGALRFLLDLARAAEKTEKIEELAEVLAGGLVDALEADRVFLLIGRDAAMHPVERKLPKHMQRIYSQSYSQTVIDEVVQTRMAVLSNTTEDARFRDARSIHDATITSAICVPLIVREELLGTIYLDRLGSEDSFTQQQLEFATAAGLQCAVALLNIRRTEELRAARDRLEAELSGPDGFVGQSKALRPVYEFIERAAPTDAGVLIQGESGTGKELVARAIHRQSPRVDRAFVIVNCAALAENLAEAELFGHERGAFTGADRARPGKFLAADGGSIFLDEIGELTEPIQAKLLRVLESGEIMPVGEASVRTIDVRVIAATNRDLAKEVEAGRFRRDLYYRLNILRVELPALRQRADDVELLIRHFVRFFGERCGRPNLRISDAAMDCCRRYTWPGNVRELKNAVERMVILARGEELDVRDLPPELGGAGTISTGSGGVGGLRSLAEVERDHILAVLEEVDGNKKRAAEILQIDRTTLYTKLRQYGTES